MLTHLPAGRIPVRVEGATKRFRQGESVVEAIKDVCLSIEEGEFVAVMGASGSGKSTLLHVMAGLAPPDEGRVQIDGADLSTMPDGQLTRFRRRKIGLVFQAFNLIGDLTVYENVELPLTYRGMPSSERKRRAQEALERVGMSHRMKHYPSQLSGGQQQRVAVARALGGEPLILLADEPTGNLDSANGEAVMSLLRELHAAGSTICMVTHDPRYAEFADRTVRLFDGRVVEESTDSANS